MFLGCCYLGLSLIEFSFIAKPSPKLIIINVSDQKPQSIDTHHFLLSLILFIFSFSHGYICYYNLFKVSSGKKDEKK